MRYLILVTWILCCACHNNTPIKFPSYEKPQEFPHQLKELFKNGEHHAILTTNKELTNSQKKIVEKLAHLMTADKITQEEFDKILHYPKMMENTSKIGLSKKELQALSSFFMKKETLTEQGVVIVSADEKFITFKGTGRLSILDSVTIISKDTSALFNDTRLEYYQPDSSFLRNDFISPDEHFEYVVPFTQSSNGLLELLPIGRRYTFFVGRLSKTAKTYIFLEINELGDIYKPFKTFYSIILD
jgi:hypothetical protein